MLTLFATSDNWEDVQSEGFAVLKNKEFTRIKIMLLGYVLIKANAKHKIS